MGKELHVMFTVEQEGDKLTLTSYTDTIAGEVTEDELNQLVDLISNIKDIDKYKDVDVEIYLSD